MNRRPFFLRSLRLEPDPGDDKMYVGDRVKLKGPPVRYGEAWWAKTGGARDVLNQSGWFVRYQDGCSGQMFDQYFGMVVYMEENGSPLATS